MSGFGVERDGNMVRLIGPGGQWIGSMPTEQAFALARDLTKAADDALGAPAPDSERERLTCHGTRSEHDYRCSNPQTRLIDAMHTRTGRCLGGNHLDCAEVEQRHHEGTHDMCLPVEDGKSGWDDQSLYREHQPDEAKQPGIDQGCCRDDGCEAVHDCDGYHRESVHFGNCCHQRHPEPVEYGSDRRRADWDSLTPDQKVAARLDGSEYREPTLEERVEGLERQVRLLAESVVGNYGYEGYR